MSTYSGVVLASSPSLYWRLGESAGTTAADASGNSRTGTYGSGITLAQTGGLALDADTAVALDGTTNGKVTSTYNPFSGSITLEGWFFRNTTTPFDAFFGGSGANRPALYAVGGSTDISWEATSGTTAKTWVAACPTAAWFHLVLTYNPAGSAELWINGVSKGTGGPGTFGAAPGNFIVGAVSGANFAGRADEVAVYSSVLSGATILDHYQAGTRTGPYAPAPPTVVTQAASSISATGATLNGTVNPNGKSTTAIFEWGLTTGYGTTVSLGTVGSDSTVHALSTGLSSLTTGTTYHYRISATNSDGTSLGSDQTFVPVAAATVTIGSVLSGKPPLDLHAEVTLADGSRYRWDSGASSAADRPQGISFRTRKGEGFADAGCALSRRIDRDYVDLNLLDDFAFVGYDGSTAYEGRVGANPRSLGESSHQMTVQLQGWMSHGKDRKFVEVWVDRDTGAWGPPTLNRRATGLTAQSQGDFDWTTEPGSLVCVLPNQALPAQAIAELWYAAPAGLTIAGFQYTGSETLPASWEVAKVFISSDDALTTSENYALTLNSAKQSVSITTARRYAMLREYANGTASTPAVGSKRSFSSVAVYGNHGLTTRTIDAATPDGLYASDVISNIASRFCPKLNTAGVQATTYPIPHLVHGDAIYPYDAWLDVNKFHLWSLGVWENKTLTYKPYDLSDYDWEVRLSDYGVTVDLQGDSVEQLANGMCVNYTDVATGTPARITPADDTTLLDTSVNNPANLHGLTLWTEITLSSPTTAVAAAQIGRAALAEFNQPKGPGTIRVDGHIRDRAGHWQQAWKVRADQRIAITDHPNDRPRLIVETDWNHDSKQLTIGVDSTLQRVDAVLDRISTALQAANLT